MYQEKESLLSNSNSRSLTANNQLIDYIDSFSLPELPRALRARAIPIFLESLIYSGSQCNALI